MLRHLAWAFVLNAFFISFLSTASAQNARITGVVLDQSNQQPAQGAVVALQGTSFSTLSDEQGRFSLQNIPAGAYKLNIRLDNFVEYNLDVSIAGKDLNLSTIGLAPRGEAGVALKEDLIPTISLSDDNLEVEGNNQNISGILTASRDVFVSAAAFTFGPARFRVRGYDSEYVNVFLNGLPFNDLDNGRVTWNVWGGLNDVTRNREVDLGTGPISYTFGGVGGGNAIDTRASFHRKQLRLSYSLSNGTFRNRIMGTWSTGLMQNGWAFTLSGSRRWAQEGYVEGTFFDGWAYFLSVDKKIDKDHSLNFTAFDAPIRRGRSTSSVSELYDLTGTNFYNPLWGFQNGEKRNSSEVRTQRPVFMLRHDWNIHKNAVLITAASIQIGKDGNTGLDWFDAPDPRPSYYRYLPSYVNQQSTEEGGQVAEDFRNNPNISQVNWAALYDVNRNSLLDQKYANLLNGQTPEGAWSQYVIEERRSDIRDFSVSSNYQATLTDNFKLHAGAVYQRQTVQNFKVIDDLLGGDYAVNVNRFVIRDFPGNFDVAQNDLNDPSRIIHEGDRFGYDYDANIRRGELWAQGVYVLPNVEAFISGSIGQTTFWRNGKMRNGMFPDNSFGNSEKQNFLNVGGKAGVTYKLDGRNYFFVNGFYQTRAPFFDNSYISPRTRADLIPNLTNEKILSVEGGYLLRAPNVKARAVAYLTQFSDQARILRFYNDDLEGAFVNYVITGQDRRHAGLELALEAKISPSLKLSGVAALGQYIYNSRPTGNVYLDNPRDLTLGDNRAFDIYAENFRLAGMPQTAYTAGINYSSPKFWFVNLNFNYFDNIWVDFNPIRRTANAVYGLDPTDPLLRNIVDQEQAPATFTMDFFGGKSWRIRSKYYLYLNVGVNNVLDNKNFITGGFEQLRFDFETRNPDLFPNRYFYNFGRNFFINLSLRI